jgi:hypothetical protein
MLRGDALVQKRELLLLYLYNEGAIAPNCAVDAVDVQQTIDLSDDDLESLFQNLHSASLVDAQRGWWSVGAVSGGEFKMWLTPDGLEKAGTIAQRVRDEIDTDAKPPIGFLLPRDGE